MNIEILRKHVFGYAEKYKQSPSRFEEDIKERNELSDYYRQFTKERINSMTAEEVYDYLSKLWAMLMWGNKHYVIDKIIEQNGLDKFRAALGSLVWDSGDIAIRWDSFRKNIKGVGPAMTSELLCKTHPNDYMIWNRPAYNGLSYLQVEGLPKYDYQLTGKIYAKLCHECKTVGKELRRAGLHEHSLLAVDYFIWDELTSKGRPPVITGKGTQPGNEPEVPSPQDAVFIHDEIRDKLRDIGQWLGFSAKTEQIVSSGSKIDTIWEATIGNMGRVIYVFEVQTKGSIDSLMLNLLKSLKNPAVQGIVAVSDPAQLEKIRKHAKDVRELSDKLKYWDYEEVIKTHEGLQLVYDTINKLGLVPQGF